MNEKQPKTKRGKGRPKKKKEDSLSDSEQSLELIKYYYFLMKKI